MRFDGVPAVRLQDLGVSFRYLVFKLRSGAEEMLLVRGMNFRPYEPEIEQRVLNQTLEELKEYGFQADRDELASNGGGTAALNPFYETITLFGTDAQSNVEDSRPEVHRLFQEAFLEYKVTWYSKDHAAQVERKEKEAKAKKKAALAAAKAKKEEAAKATADAKPSESSQASEETS